jgi:hypothetical protein
MKDLENIENIENTESGAVTPEEVISDAIGDIKDKYIESVDAIRTSDIRVVRRPMIWQIMPAAAAAVVLAIGTLILWNIFRADLTELDPNDSDTAPPIETTIPLETPNIPESGYVWVVEPTLTFEGELGYCEHCSSFHDFYNGFISPAREGHIIDTETGLPMDIWHDTEMCMALNYEWWVYDPVLELIGYASSISLEYTTWFPVSILETRHPHLVNRFFTVYKTDSTSWLVHNGNSYNRNGNVHLGDSVVFLRDNSLHEFDVPPYQYVGEVAPYHTEHGMGVVTTCGTVLVPPEFAWIKLINDQTAFVKVDGYWGIIGFNGYEPCDEPPPPQPPEPPTIPGVAWFVPPTVFNDTRYSGTTDMIFYSRHGDLFRGGYCEILNSDVLNERTLEYTGNLAPDGGFGGLPTWVYDPQLNLLGYTRGDCSGSSVVLFRPSEFAARFAAIEPSLHLNWYDSDFPLLLVHEVDSTLRSNESERWDWLEEEAFTGRAAAFYNGQFVTEFEFASLVPCNWRTDPVVYVPITPLGRLARFATVMQDGKFGVVNHSGEIVVPFELDNILIIDDYTAFARVGYFWGIITWVDPADVPHRESPGGWSPDAPNDDPTDEPIPAPVLSISRSEVESIPIFYVIGEIHDACADSNLIHINSIETNNIRHPIMPYPNWAVHVECIEKLVIGEFVVVTYTHDGFGGDITVYLIVD